MEPPPAHARAAGGADVGYTFMPKTNPVRPAAMPSAAMYVQAPIYERLARTNTRSQVERERQVAADLERMEAAQREKVGGGGGEEAAGAGASAPPSLPDLSAEEQRRLAVFLARQEAAALRKKKHLEEIEKATAPSGQPALCDKSLKIVESATNNASFLERLQRSMVEKEEEVRNGAAVAPHPTAPLTPSPYPLPPLFPPAAGAHQGAPHPRHRVHVCACYQPRVKSAAQPQRIGHVPRRRAEKGDRHAPAAAPLGAGELGGRDFQARH
jgi:hypothetical protein